MNTRKRTELALQTQLAADKLVELAATELDDMDLAAEFIEAQYRLIMCLLAERAEAEATIAELMANEVLVATDAPTASDTIH